MVNSPDMSPREFAALLADVRACTLCAPFLPHGPRPVLQLHRAARILIVGQAPGSKVHKTGVPFDDQSGDRLRDWLGIDSATFYDEKRIALLPMGFCYPGTGKSGDLPPRPECAATWREQLLAQLPNIELTIVIGQYAQAWHLGVRGGKAMAKANLTETVAAWREYWPTILPLPHPSPRNNIWLKRNDWFASDVLPSLRKRVAVLLR